MHMSIRKIFLSVLLVLILALSSGLGFSHSVSGHSSSGNVQPAIAADSSPYTLYLPRISNRFPLETIFGVEMNPITTGGGLDLVAAANTTWVRRNGVLWADVETNEGVRDWSALAGLEQELIDASANNMQVILIVRKTPDWAQKVPGYACGPIKPEKLGAFGNFMHDLVSRYSRPPYNVKYWEMWNEPDVSPELAGLIVGGSLEFGCWGDSADAYYGGGYFAEMLKAVYPRIKAADPLAQVVIGGLLLDCDPRPGAGCAVLNHDDKPPRFFEGILRHNGLNDGGNYFDGANFHAYDFYYGQQGRYGNFNWQTAWNTTGPVMVAKTQFIQSLLRQYGVFGKFLMNTETAVICGLYNDPPGQPPCDSEPTSAFEQTKAYYAAQVYAAAIAEGLRANIWYSALGWCNSGLLTSSGAPRPAYYAYQFSRSELMNASFVGNIGSVDIGGVTGIKGYKFNRGDRTIWLLWSLDGSEHNIPFSMPPRGIFDLFGNYLPTGNALQVTLAPVYIEW
jgi:hypothetical protein